MIRCNNCGWFNPDTATHCEMCDEELAGLPIEKPVEIGDDNERVPTSEPLEDTHALENSQSPSSPMMETVRMKNSGPQKQNSSFSATVLDSSSVFNTEESVQCPKCRYPVYGFVDTCPNCGASLKRAMQDAPQVSSSVPARTVPELEPVSKNMPAPTVIVDSGHLQPPCPVDHPSNTLHMKGTVRDNPSVNDAFVKPLPKKGKETIREIPADLVDDIPVVHEQWRLIPVESPDSETIVMSLGDVIQIGNRKYKFQK